MYSAPVIIVIFGITGDLAKKKLIPALWKLFINGYLPKEFFVVGFARRQLTDSEAQEYVKSILEARYNEEELVHKEEFLSRVHYVTGNFDDAQSYETLARTLHGLDGTLGVCTAKVFHIATSPALYDGIFEQVHASGLSQMCDDLGGWTRILVEKPFGNNWDTAKELDEKLGRLFREDQIFRVDHYMGKESVQNILAFRFANSLLEHLWNNQFIEKISIRLWEKIGLEGRGSFYDTVGTLRDVGQNHILQMLAFIAMEDPKVFDAEHIRNQRWQVLQSLVDITENNLASQVTRGQFIGYKNESSVNKDSTTETYFNIKANINNDRWQGVPFYLESGKNLGESKVEIEVVFKKKDTCMTSHMHSLGMHNRLLFRIQPNEAISLTFLAKYPGFGMNLSEKVLSFSSQNEMTETYTPDAYERVIFDCILGDQTLFASTDEVLASWKFITPIINTWNVLPIKEYPVGWVPSEV